MFEMTNENVARLLKGLTIAVGNRKNRILIYQFLAAEIRALHYSYGVGDGESYQRALTFLEECERLLSLQNGEMQGDFAKMQGRDYPGPAKRCAVPSVWPKVSLLR